MKSFKSKNYTVACGSLQGRGTFIIINKENKCTSRFVGMEGVKYYIKLKVIYNKSRKAFDKECSSLDFHK